MHFTSWQEAPRVQVRPGVVRQVVSGRQVMFALNTVEPGMQPNPHSHPQEQIIYVMAGRLRLTVGGETRVLGPGGLCVVPPNVAHHSVVEGDEPVAILDAFSPIREDYLPK